MIPSWWYVPFVILLCIVVFYTDLRWMRVPNGVTLPLIAVGLIGQMLHAGWLPGLQQWLLGLLVSLLTYILFHFDLIGGGDVKFVAAVGALTGWQFTLYALWVGSLLGGVMALGVFVWRGWRQIWNWHLLRQAGVAPHEPPIPLKAISMPYAVPLSIGTLYMLLASYKGWWPA